MDARQKEAIESYRNVQRFLIDYPPPEPATYAGPRELLDDVVARLTDNSAEQAHGRQLTQGERRHQQVLMKRLREHHLRPLVVIARAEGLEHPEIGKSFRMPAGNLGALKLMAEAGGMYKGAQTYEAVFVKQGRPADFLKQLAEAVEAVSHSMVGRARSKGRRAGAGAAIEQQIKRGRVAVAMLDAVVRVAFELDAKVLAAWNIAKKVKRVPSTSSTFAAGAADPVAA